MKVVKVEKIELTHEETELIIQTKRLMEAIEKESEADKDIYNYVTDVTYALNQLLKDDYSYVAP